MRFTFSHHAGGALCFVQCISGVEIMHNDQAILFCLGKEKEKIPVDLFQSERKIYCDKDDFFDWPAVSPLAYLVYSIGTTISSCLCYQSMRPRVTLTFSLSSDEKIRGNMTFAGTSNPLWQCGSSTVLQEPVHC